MLNIRQKLFIKKYLETKSATQAAYEAYCCKNRNVAAVTGYRVLRNVNVSSTINKILDKAGISDETIAQSLKEIINLGSIKGIKLALKLMGLGNI